MRRKFSCRRPIACVGIWTLLIACALCAEQDKSSHPPGSVTIEATSAILSDGSDINYESGTLYVPERRGDSSSRTIGVGFARFKALTATGAPPMFHLPGGPGMSLIDGLFRNEVRLRHLARYRQAGDVILVDQRGFSQHGDVLRFAYRSTPEPLEEPASVARSTAFFRDTARRVVAKFGAQGVDLRGYTILECADDVNDLRKALGYSQITLVGTSFGSQWSFAVLKRHPGIVARALLSGIEPLDFGYDMPSHVFAAVRRIWWQAEQDPAIQPYLPRGGLMAASRTVLERLERAPVRTTVTDPQKNSVAVTLGRDDFQRDAFNKDAAGPALILSIFHGHYDAWARDVLAQRQSHDASLRLIGPLIDTSLGVTPERKFLLRTDSASEFLGPWNFDAYLASADIWPTEDVGDEFRASVLCTIPVVMTHGDWDTKTPLENALHALAYFPNGRLVVAEHGGHGVIASICDSSPDARRALHEFLTKGTTTDLPARVRLPVPRFPRPDFPPPGK